MEEQTVQATVDMVLWRFSSCVVIWNFAVPFSDLDVKRKRSNC